jgi:hypothetical protein
MICQYVYIDQSEPSNDD